MKAKAGASQNQNVYRLAGLMPCGFSGGRFLPLKCGESTPIECPLVRLFPGRLKPPRIVFVLIRAGGYLFYVRQDAVELGGVLEVGEHAGPPGSLHG